MWKSTIFLLIGGVYEIWKCRLIIYRARNVKIETNLNEKLYSNILKK